MNRDDLYRAVGEADDRDLARSEEKRPRHRWGWMGAVAALLVLVLAGGLVFRPPLTTGGGVRTEYVICEPDYPRMAPYPEKYTEVSYDAWEADVEAQRRDLSDADKLEPFFARSMAEFLSGPETENQLYAPLNLYMALAMLSELTAGESRDQLLDLLGSESLEALRNQADDIWNAHYRDDGATATILASSLWLDEGVDFVKATLETLGDRYYAASYRGDLGSREMEKALQAWLKEQTHGLLDEAAQGVELPDEAVLALATTIFYRARWQNEFDPARTAPDTFHSPAGDREVDFLNATDPFGTLWEGEQFTAAHKNLDNGGGTLYFILPREGVTPADLLRDPEALDFLAQRYKWEGWTQRDCILHLSVPKFDVQASLDLQEGLEALGITDVFDPGRADFTPTTPDQGLVLASAQHAVRVALDEEGVTAAAFTVMAEDGAACPGEQEEVWFTLDRPFIFVLDSEEGLPLFTGVVNCP